MDKILEQLKKRLKQKPTNVDEVKKLVQQITNKRKKISDRQAKIYLYKIDYAPGKNSEKWSHDPEAKINAISEALYNLEKSIICDLRQSFLLEVINNQHKKIRTISDRLSDRGVDISTIAISYIISKYGVKKNTNGFYHIEGLTDELQTIAAKHHSTPYLTVQKYLTDTLNQRLTTAKEIVDLTEAIGHKVSYQTAYRYLYDIDYAPTEIKGEWAPDPEAKLNAITNALRRLAISELCDLEQCYLLEIMNYEHESWKSIFDGLYSRGIEVTSSNIQYLNSKFGVKKNEYGFYCLERVTGELENLAIDYADRRHLTFQQYLSRHLKRKAVTIEQVIKIAEYAVHDLDEDKAKQCLYEIDYTPGKKEQWVHDPMAKLNAISKALKNLEKSDICNEEQSFLLEIINYRHDSHNSIVEGLKQRGLETSKRFVMLAANKFGVKKNKDGIYQLDGIHRNLKRITNLYKDRQCYNVEQFVIDYVQANNGQCSIDKILDALKAAAPENYHFKTNATIKWYLSKNRISLEGKKQDTKQITQYIPEEVRILVNQAYDAFVNGADYQNTDAIVLYYVAHHNLSASKLANTLNEKHGIPKAHTKQSITSLGLVKTKAGLCFPEESNAEGGISKEAFQQATKDKLAKSLADHVYELYQSGESFLEIRKLFNDSLSQNEVRQLVRGKRKHNQKNNSSRSSSGGGPQNSLQDVTGDPVAPIDYDFFQKMPVTPEERLKQHNKEQVKRYQQQFEELRQQYTSQKIYVPLFEQLYLNQQVHAQQNVQNNIIQLQPRINQQLAATGTDGFAASSPPSQARRSHNHMAPIRQLPSVKSNVKTSPPIARVSNFAHPTGVMILGMYTSRIIAYKATQNAKFADRLSELSAYPIASSLLFYHVNNVGVSGGLAATSRATLYYTATKAPPVAAATAVATIIATPFIQLKKYADMANDSANKQREKIINTVLFQAKQDPDYFAQTFYSHEEREDLFREGYGVFSLNKTELQTARDKAFMDYELADTSLSTMESMLDMKQDEELNEKKSVLLQIRSNALSFLKSTYPTPQSSNISFGAFDHFK